MSTIRWNPETLSYEIVDHSDLARKRIVAHLYELAQHLLDGAEVLDGGIALTEEREGMRLSSNILIRVLPDRRQTASGISNQGTTMSIETIEEDIKLGIGEVRSLVGHVLEALKGLIERTHSQASSPFGNTIDLHDELTKIGDSTIAKASELVQAASGDIPATDGDAAQSQAALDTGAAPAPADVGNGASAGSSGAQENSAATGVSDQTGGEGGEGNGNQDPANQSSTLNQDDSAGTKAPGDGESTQDHTDANGAGESDDEQKPSQES